MTKLVILLMGRVLLMCGVLQLIPLCYGLYHSLAAGVEALFESVLATFFVGSGFVSYGRSSGEKSLSVLAGASFLFVCWWALAALGGLPYYFSGELSFFSAFFDAISCFTTTGIMDLPYEADAAIILWRSFSQWMGGYMVLLLLSTILPGTSGCFGTAFVLPGSLRTGAITLKRIDRTFWKIFRIYSLATVLGALLYLLCGLSMYDAVNMSLVTISTGGCYALGEDIRLSGWVVVTAFLGLVAAGCNIFMYWQAIDYGESRILKKTWQNSEMRIFAVLVLAFTALIGVHLYAKGFYALPAAFSNAFFHVISFGCTNGIMASAMYHWDDLDKFFLIFMALIGGCMGSIAGGFKIFRLQVLLKSSFAEMKRTLHPNIVLHIMIDGKTVPQNIVERILGYFFMFFLALLVSLLVISLSGLDMQQTLDVAIACITSSGPMMMFHLSPEEVRGLPDWVKLYCSLLMIVGKINVFTFLLILNGMWTGLREKHW